MKPQSSFQVKCGFELGKAVVAAGACAEACNERFGDSIDPAYCVAAVTSFFKSGADVKCRTCGWVKDGKCTQNPHTIDAGGTCPLYRHVHVIADDRG